MTTLGHGRNGPVLLDTTRGVPLAVKRLCGVADQVAGLRARAALLPQHPGLLGAVDIQVEGPDVLVFMEVVHGEPWLTYLRQDVRSVAPGRPTLVMAFGQILPDGGKSMFLPCTATGLRHVRSSFHALTSALAALHAVGLVHGDLQPDNVVMTNGQPLLLDLFDTRLHEPSVSYSPPEAGGALTAAGDVYALGVMLFEALTGGLPFSGSALDVAVRKQTVSAPNPGLLVDVPADLDTLVVHMLRRVPQNRPTMANLLTQLKQLASGELMEGHG